MAELELFLCALHAKLCGEKSGTTLADSGNWQWSAIFQFWDLICLDHSALFGTPFRTDPQRSSTYFAVTLPLWFSNLSQRFGIHNLQIETYEYNDQFHIPEVSDFNQFYINHAKKHIPKETKTSYSKSNYPILYKSWKNTIQNQQPPKSIPFHRTAHRWTSSVGRWFPTLWPFEPGFDAASVGKIHDFPGVVFFRNFRLCIYIYKHM